MQLNLTLTSQVALNSYADYNSYMAVEYHHALRKGRNRPGPNMLTSV